jgi:hypothetical protein
MFYDEQKRAFVVDTVEETQEEQTTQETFTPESNNEYKAFAFSTLL